MASEKKNVADQDKAGYISQYTFWWMTPVLSRAEKNGRLTEGDIPKLPSQDHPERLYERLRQILSTRKKISGW